MSAIEFFATLLLNPFQFVNLQLYDLNDYQFLYFYYT